MAAEDLEIGSGLVVPGGELSERASRSGGPGGQHVNKTATRVTLRWNVFASQALDDGQRARLAEALAARLTRAGDLVVHAGESRSRARNLEAARERLAELVAEALQVPRPRTATRPSRAARARRVRDKRQRGDVKLGRRRVEDEDE